MMTRAAQTPPHAMFRAAPSDADRMIRTNTRTRRVVLPFPKRGAKPEVEIRRARLHDSVKVLNASRTTDRFRVSGRTSSASIHELRFWTRDPRAVFLVAVAGTRLLGYAYGFLISPYWLVLDSILVLPRVRGTGLGMILYESMRDECRRLGVELMQGWVKEDAPRTIDYLVKKGFKRGCRCVWVEDWINDKQS